MNKTIFFISDITLLLLLSFFYFLPSSLVAATWPVHDVRGLKWWRMAQSPNFKYQQRSRSNRQWSAYHTDGASGQVWGVESGGVKTLYAVCEMCKVVVKKTTTTSKKKSRTWEWDGTGIIFLAWRQDKSIFVGIGKNISENSHPQKWNIHAHTYTVYTCTHPHFMAGSICLATIQQLFFSSC